MALDLKAQAEERQKRLQRERDEEIEFSHKIRRDCKEMDKDRHPRAMSVQDKNLRN